MRNFFYNYKKLIIISSAILALIIVATIAGFVFLRMRSSNSSSDFTYSKLISYDNVFSITVNDVFDFKKQDKNDDYNLILKSYNYNSSIYISSFDLSKIRSIEDVLNSDKKIFLSNFQNASEISELSSKNISDYKVYEYHFKTSNRIIQNYYVLTENKIYIFDFDIDKNNDYEYNLEDFTEEIIKSFKLL